MLPAVQRDKQDFVCHKSRRSFFAAGLVFATRGHQCFSAAAEFVAHRATRGRNIVKFSHFQLVVRVCFGATLGESKNVYEGIRFKLQG
jgi:hypothetical protein